MKFSDIFEKIMATLIVITFVMFLIGLVIGVVSNIFIWWLILPIVGYLCIHIISWIIINLILNGIWGLDIEFFTNN